MSPYSKIRVEQGNEVMMVGGLKVTIYVCERKHSSIEYLHMI